MPVHGGILNTGNAARCLSSAAGMLRFLARLSGRRRHVRRSCGPGGGCCVAAASVNTGETRTGTRTTTTTTAALSAAASVTREVVAGGTTTMTSVHQDRRKDSSSEEQINRIEDPSWIEENFRDNNARNPDEKDSRFSTLTENHDENNSRFFTKMENSEENNSRFSTKMENSEERNSRFSTITENSEEKDLRFSTKMENSRFSTITENSEEKVLRFSKMTENSEEKNSRFSKMTENSEEKNSRFSKMTENSEEKNSRFSKMTEKSEEKNSRFSKMTENSEEINSRFSKMTENSEEKNSRFSKMTENHEERKQVNSHRQERTRNSNETEKQDLKSHPHIRECSRLKADEEFSEIPREKSQRLSMDDLDDCQLHRVEEIPENQRLNRRQRLHRTSRCRSKSTTNNDALDDWSTRPGYVDLIVREHENTQRGNEQQQTDNTNFCNSNTRRSRIPPYLATLLIISYTLFGIADACSSRSTPKPRPPTVTSRPNITFHMYTCPPDYAEWYCLNGATCFTVKIQESLLYNCICSDGFIGQRCEFKDLDGSYLPSRQRVMLETASIAGGATIAVFLVVIICIAAYIHCKRKQKELRTSSTCVDTVDGPGRDPELRPFSNRSLMIFMAKNPNGSTMCPSIEQTRMPGWNDYSQMESARMASVNEGKRGSSQ